MSEQRVLLLTDVVDSTKLSETIGDDAMAALWTAHDRAARDLLPIWGGREIDKTDGMLLMFEQVNAAVCYALAYHQALAELPLPIKARAGLHLGSVILRENSAEDVARGAKPLEVDGLAKPMAARTMSLAQGGQTLMTADARRALAEGSAQCHSHGHWVLKGIHEPVELFEITLNEQAPVAPPDGDKGYRVVRVADRWVPVRQVPNNLPQQNTSFLGREKEIADIKLALTRSRLVTLLGMGGLGKTRLSLQVAAEVTHEFPDGVWFLDLAPLRDASLVVSEAAQVMGLREEPGRRLIQTLCLHLKDQRALLVVDNCEHLVHACAELATELLRAAPQLRLLTSSREALRAPGEQAYAVLPLPVPKTTDSLEVLMRSTAVGLFIERAQQHKSGFTVLERDAPVLAELVGRLEGIPLAIELAAARVRQLSVPDINKRLKDRYKLLTGGGRVALERQQTLRALVDWSYDMLPTTEQVLLQRLAVFAGGFDLAGVEAVCGIAPLDSLDVLDTLGFLVEKSLVMVDESDDTTRYKMLETIREYAREKLEQSGDLPGMAARHCEHFFAFAKDVKRGLMGPEQADWIWRAEADHDNLRGAMSVALSGTVDPFISVKLAVALQGFWILRGYSTEGRNLVLSAMELPAIQTSDQAQAHALYVGAALAESQSDFEDALTMLDACLNLRRRLGEPQDIAATLSTLTMARLPLGEVDSAREGELEALALFRQQRNKIGEAIGLLHLGLINLYGDDTLAAKQVLLEGLSLAKAIKHQEVVGECELLLGQIDFVEDSQALACQRFARSLSVCRDAGDRRGEAQALRWLGRTDLKANDHLTAKRRLGEALSAFRAFEMRAELLGCLEDHAVLALAQGAIDLAIGLASSAAQSRLRLGLADAPQERQHTAALLAALRASSEPREFQTAWETGQNWETDDCVRYAQAMSAPVGAAATAAA